FDNKFDSNRTYYDIYTENRTMEKFDRCFNQVLAFLEIDPLPVEVIWKFIEKLETCFDELSCPLVDVNDESIVVKESLELKLNYVMERFKVKLGKSSSNKKSHGLPRESVPVWGGEPYLFPPFWFSIKSRILSVDNMSDSEKLSRVLSALPESVRLIVFGLSLDELELVLKRKFLSFNTLSEFLVLKLSKVKVENNDDVLVLKEILVILESSQRLASSIVELNGQSDLLFKMNNTIFGSIFCLLPSELQKKFVDKFQLEDVSNLIQFVNDEVEKKIAHIRFLGNSSVLKQSKVKVVQDKQKESKNTGAKSSILPESLFPVQPGTETKYFGTVNKQDVFATKGPITKTLVVNDGLELRFDTYVGNTSFPIIGRDFIKKYKVKWNDERMIGESLDKVKFTLGQADVDEHDGLSALFLVTADDLEDISLDEKQNDLSKEMKSLLDKWSCLSDGLGHTKVVKHRICVRPEFDVKYETNQLNSDSREVVQRKVKSRLVGAERKMKLVYDRRNRKTKLLRDFHNRRVYWKQFTNKSKLVPLFKGPFMAQRTLNPLNYKIIGQDRKSKIVNINQLKLCHNETLSLDNIRDRGRPRSGEEGVI
ncbi:hypothetical protein BLOT_010266, partial [Blomia tropicalis]